LFSLRRRSAKPRRFRVHYLLESSGLFGGVKVVLAQAELLTARGHEVTIVGREPAPDWYPLQSSFVRSDPLRRGDMPAPDVVVATFWTTIEPALRFGSPVVHYCQGYEGLHGRERSEQAEIERVYARRLPAMVSSPHLGELLRDRFGRPWRLVPPIVEEFWRPSPEPWDGRRAPRVLVVGTGELPLKGVETALRAVGGLRASGLECVLVRLSPTPPADIDGQVKVDEFHHRAPPHQAARVFRGADLLLAPSHESEGFGLPVLEAMASGVPVVASDVSCFRGFAAEAAVLVPPHDVGAFVHAAGELLSDRSLWLRHREFGLSAAARFTAAASAAIVEGALAWVVDGDWRED
jgi:glycosyltransferase involved in cell wall biosynthesis